VLRIRSRFRFAARFSSGNWRGVFWGGSGLGGWVGRWVGAGREVVVKVEGGGGGGWDVMDRKK